MELDQWSYHDTRPFHFLWQNINISTIIKLSL